MGYSVPPSTASNWNLEFLGTSRTIWGGCIIRAKFLNRITEAYARDPKLHISCSTQYFTDIIAKTQRNWRVAVSTAIIYGAWPRRPSALPWPLRQLSFRASSGEFAASAARLFGAHTYERIDKPGIFHTDWIGDQPAQEMTEPKPTSKRPRRRMIRPPEHVTKDVSS